MIHRLLLLITINFLFLQCSSKEVNNSLAELTTSSSTKNQVYSFSNKATFETFKALNLDSTHANLLNPQVSKESHQQVAQAWVKLHTDISAFLSENNFEWDSSDSTVKVFHKIYFDTTGHIKHHFINVLSPSVNESTKAAFAKHLVKFGRNYQLDIKRDIPFAQCGPARYTNKPPFYLVNQ